MNRSYTDETVLVTGLRDGDEAAYEYLVREHGGRLLSVIRRILRNEDESADALQDTFIAAFKNIDRFEGAAKLTTWLHQIAVNAALMKLRKKRNIHERSVEDLLPQFLDDGHRADVGPTWTLTADQVAEQAELTGVVHEQIAALPDQYREVIVLRDIEQVSTDEAAQVLNITPGALKVRLHRARQALRKLLEPHMAGEKSA
ncbi:sigma-70 family RNA polymerase sigma factor [Planctomycetales bacterium ZRK34]|nr:sigma-70 family RNA polymerase sigma factor [Planctomycetales bacterium ZRK34]